jgi:hypothetical protein
MMAKRSILAALVACCLTPAVHAQWGLSGDDADPRYLAEGGAATMTQENIPGIDLIGEYLLWWLKDPKVSSPLPGGVSGDNLKYSSPFSGGRLTARFWTDSTTTGSFEASGFVVGPRSTTTISGNTLATAKSFLWGAEGDFFVNTLTPLDLFAGFRYLDLTEDLNVTSGTAAARTFDHFHTRNQYYGGQLGVHAAYFLGGFFVDGQGQVAFGSNHQTVLVSGTTTAATGAVTQGGLLATAANSGVVNNTVFSIVPEVRCRLGYMFVDGAIIFAGYNFLFMNHVVRPGDQIPAAAGGPVTLKETTFWAHGITAGIEVRY